MKKLAACVVLMTLLALPASASDAPALSAWNDAVAWIDNAISLLTEAFSPSGEPESVGPYIIDNG
ncbi:MAG: hypothetical protein AAGN46_14975 [Acidobacteriota bacterium]